MTMSIALRNIRASVGRFAFSVAGVAVATLLLAFILALYRGWNDGLGYYIESSEADVWVSARGSESFFAPGFFSRSFIPRIEEQPGVVSVDPLVYRPSKLRFEGEGFDTWAVGSAPDGAGGPAHLESGSGTPGRGEVVIDEVLANLSGAGIGDTVDLGGTPLRVVGISSGGNVVFAQIIFVSEEEAVAELAALVESAGSIGESFIPEANINLALVVAEPGQADAVAASINENMAAVRAFVSEDFADSSGEALRQSMSPVLLVVLFLAFIVGTLVVGLTVYTAVLEKEREYGVIKAIGTPPSGLLRPILEQSLACCVIGFVFGIAGAFVAAEITRWAIPQFILSFRLSDIALVFAGSVAMSVLAAVIPASRIMRVDSMSVFRA